MKSSNIITSDDELSNIRKKGPTISTPLILIKKSKKKLKLERPQTCPASINLKIIDKKSQNLSSNKNDELMNPGRIYEETNRQRAGVSLSDVVLRKKKSYLESAHQSISDIGLKQIFPRKRSIRTTLKDALSSPKRKRRLIKNSNQNSRNKDGNNFIHLCSGSIKMNNDGIFQEKQNEKDKKIEEIFDDNNSEEKISKSPKLNEKSSSLKIDEDKKNKSYLETPTGFQDRELFFDKNLNLMTNYFKEAINALHETIIIKREKESRDLKLGENMEEDKLDKAEVSELFSKMEETVDVGTNDDGEKNEKAPESGVECKVDRFRNLLEKISMLRRDVTILLEDAGKNDKPLEFFRNSGNFSRSFNVETRGVFVKKENLNEKLVKNRGLARNLISNLAENLPQKVAQNSSQIEPQNMLKNIYQNAPKIEANLPQNLPKSQTQIPKKIFPQNSDKNLLVSEVEAQSKIENKSTINEEDDIQILKVITNNDGSNFYPSETNLDGDYHFLLSLYQQLTRMPQGRKLKMRLKMQQLFYEEICTIDSD